MKLKIFCYLIVILLISTACVPTEFVSQTTSKTDVPTTTTTTPTPSDASIPSSVSLSVYSRSEVDTVEIIHSGKEGKHSVVTDPMQLDALFDLFQNTSGEYLGTVKGFYGGQIALALYKQDEAVGRVWVTVDGGYFAMDRYREWDTVRYYESRYSLTTAQAKKYVTWAEQFSYA